MRQDIRSDLCNLTNSNEVADRCDEYLSEDLDNDSRGAVLVFKGIALNNIGRPDEALNVFEQSMEYSQSPVNMACLLTNKALALYSTARVGSLMLTIKHATEVVSNLPESPLANTLRAILDVLRGIHLSLSGDRFCLEVLTESVDILMSQGDEDRAGWASICAAESALRLGDRGSAKRFLENTIGTRHRIDALLTKAWILVAEGDVGPAVRLAEGVRDGEFGLPAPRHLAWCELFSATRYRLDGQDAAAGISLTLAYALHKQDTIIHYALNDALNAFRLTLSGRR